MIHSTRLTFAKPLYKSLYFIARSILLISPARALGVIRLSRFSSGMATGVVVSEARLAEARQTKKTTTKKTTTSMKRSRSPIIHYLFFAALPIFLASCGSSGDPTPTPTPLVAPTLTDGQAQTYVAGQAIADLSFTNGGGAVPASGCKVEPELPQGLSLVVANKTCRISGTPAAEVAQDTYTITATNDAGLAEATVDITVDAGVPVLTNAPNQSYLINQAITTLTFGNSGKAIQASGCTAKSVLPAGLILSNTPDNQSCQITGTPSIAIAQTTYTITATNGAGLAEATVDITVFAPVSIGNVQLASSGDQTTPTDGDTLSLSFATTNQPTSTPQVKIGGQTATVVQGATADQWTATITVDENFESDDQGFAVIVVVPNGASPTENLNQGITVAAVQNTPAPLTLADVAAPLAPLLALGTTSYSFEANRRIAPITFTNNGGDVQASGCSASPILPMGLSFVVTGGACQIEGIPTVIADDTSHTITASNTAGTDMGATVTIAVVALREVANLVILDSAGVATGNIPSYTYSTDGNFAEATTTSSADNAGGTKLNWLETSGVIAVNYLAAPGVGRFVNQFDADPTASPAATMDLSAYAQGSLVFDINVPSYGTYTNMIVKVDSPPSCDCDQTLGKVGEGAWQTVSIPVADFTTTGTNPLDLTQVSASFVIWPDATTQQTQEMLTFMLRNIQWEPLKLPAPELVDNTDTNSLTVDLNFVPITFANSSEAAIACSVDTTTTPALPQGLEVEVMGDACQITGTPRAATPLATYTIVATSANRQTGSATVDITVSALPKTPAACSDIELLDALALGYPVTTTGTSQRLYVRGNLSNGQAHPNFIFRYKNNNIYQAAFTLDNTLAATGYDPASTEFKVASDETSPLTQFNVIDDITSDIGTTPLNLSQRYAVDRSDGQGLTGNNPVALQANGSYVFTLVFNAADLEDGVDVGEADVGELYIQDCSQNNAAPKLANIATQTLVANQAISTPITFTNSGGPVQASGCTSSNLPTGLILANTLDNQTCQITGMLTTSSPPTQYIITASNFAGIDTASVSIEVIVAPSEVVEAPDLANIIEVQMFTTGEEITPIIFINDNEGGSVAADGCSAMPALLAGLELAASGGTCQITGTPMVAIAPTLYTITASNAEGIDEDEATVTIEVALSAPALANENIARSFIVGQTIEPIIFVNSGGPVQADGCVASSGVTLGDELPDGLNLAVANGTCQITGIPGMTAPSVTHTITATNLEGSTEAIVTIEVIAVIVAPDLADITGTQTLMVGAEITPILFTNNGGAVAANGCGAASPGGGDSSILPYGLSFVVVDPNSDGETTCQITGTPVRVMTPTEYLVKARNVMGTTTASVTIEVAKGTDVLTFPEPPATVAVGDMLTSQVATTMSTQGRIIYTSADDDIATVDRNSGDVTIRSVGAGTVEITATRLADANYLEATASYTLTVEKGMDILTFAGVSGGAVTVDIVKTATITQVASGGTAAITYASDDSTNAVARVDSVTGVVTIVGVGGPITITATRAGDANYLEATASYTLTVTKATDTLMFAGVTNDAVTVPFGEAAITQVATGNAGDGALSYEVLDSTSMMTNPATSSIATVTSAGVVTIAGVGVVIIQATIAESTNYNEVTASYTLTVTKATDTLMFAGVTNDAVAVTFNETATITQVATGNAGDGEIAYEVLDSATNMPDSNVTDPIATVENATMAEVTIVGVGTVIIQATITGSTNHNDATASYTLTVNPQPPNLANIVGPQVFTIGEEVSITFTNDGAPVQANGCKLALPSEGESVLPAGLSVSVVDPNNDGETTCQITGTPMETKTSEEYFIEATNSVGGSRSTVTIEVIAATPPDLADNAVVQSFTVGQDMIPAISFVNDGGDIQADGCTVSPMLPAGLTVANTDNNRSCEITGAPTAAAESGVYTITATNGNGLNTDTATVTIEVNKGTDTLTFAGVTDDAVEATLGEAETITQAATGLGDGAITYEVLVHPGGASMPSVTGPIANVGDARMGIVTLVGEGVVIIQATIVESDNYLGTTARYTLTVNPAPEPPNLANNAVVQSFTVGQGMIPAISFVNMGGDIRASSVNVGGGCSIPSMGGSNVLPEGLTIANTDNNQSCEIIGAPIEAVPSKQYTIAAANIGGIDEDLATVTIEVNKGIDTLSFADMTDNDAVTVESNGSANVVFVADLSFTRAASGNAGDGDITYEVLDSTSMMTNSATDMIATIEDETMGVVTIKGVGTVIIRATIVESDNYLGTTARYTLTVHPPAPLLGDITQTQTLTVGESTNLPITFTNTGGPVAVGSCEVSSGLSNLNILPAGLDLVVVDPNSDGETTCQIEGTPTAATTKSDQFDITATNLGGISEVAIVNIEINKGTDTLTFADTTDNDAVTIDAQDGSANVVFMADLTFTRAATGNVGGGDITYEVLDSATNMPDSTVTDPIATIEDGAIGEVTIKGVGEVIIRAKVAGNDNYNEAVTMYTLTVAPVPDAPSLGSVDIQRFTVGEGEIDPITFFNSGGAVQEDGCEVSSGIGDSDELPAGLRLVVVDPSDGGATTCQITGAPTVAAEQSLYEITATNLGGPYTIDFSLLVSKGTDTLTFADTTDNDAVTVMTEVEDRPASVAYATNLAFTRVAMATNARESGTITYASTDEGIATVNMGSGEVRLEATGTTRITATLDDLNYSGMVSYDLTVARGPNILSFDGVTDDAVTVTFDGTGTMRFQHVSLGDFTGALSYAVLNSDGMPDSSTSSIATVDSNGGVVIKGVGTVIIRAAVTESRNYLAATAEYTLTILGEPDLVEFDSAQTSVFGVETTITFENRGGDIRVDGCAVTSGGSPFDLPEGLMVSVSADSRTCQITGRPTEVSGTLQYDIEATNASGTNIIGFSMLVFKADDTLSFAGVTDNAVEVTLGETAMITQVATGAMGDGGITYAVLDSTTNMPDSTVTDPIATVTSEGVVTLEGATGTVIIQATITGSTNHNDATATYTLTVNPAPDAPVLADIDESQSFTAGQGTIDPIIFTNEGGAVQEVAGCELTSSTRAGLGAVLPTGLILSRTTEGDPRTCQITGAPTVAIVSDVYTITATNGGGIVEATVTIVVVNPQAPVLVAPTQAMVDGIAGEEITPIIFTNTGGDIMDGGCQLTSSDSATTDLLGLVLSVSDSNRNCELTGTPTEAGVRQYDVIATNAGGTSEAATVTITVDPAPDAPSLADVAIPLMGGGTIGTAILKVGEEIDPIIFANSGGPVREGAQGCELTSSSVADTGAALPAGLILTSTTDRDPRTCQITGTPTAVTPYSEYKITGRNATGTDPATVGIEVNKGTDTLSFGEVTAESAGATVTVSGDGTIASINFMANETFTRTATVDSGRSLVSPATIAYTSSVPAVATVDPSSGVVTILTAGNTTITATLTSDTNYEGVASYALAVEPVVTGDLANAGPQTYVLRPDSSGVAIDPIVFANSGAAMTGCTVGPTLPMGLSVDVSDDDTCEITGVPTAAVGATTYTITGMNGATSTAVVTIAVVAVEDFPDFDISSNSETTGLSSGNFYSVAYSAVGDFSDIAVSSTHAKIQLTANNGITMVNYQATTGVGRLQVTQSADPANAAPVNLGDYAEGYIAFDINVPNYGNYTSMVVKSDSASVDDAVQNLGQVGHGAWQTIFFPVAEYIDAGVDLAAVTTTFVIYPDEDTQKTMEALSFMIRNIRWTNTEPFLGLGAPALADIAGMRSLPRDVEITPITFTNSGGHVTSCVFASLRGGEPTTGSFLSIAVFSGTCRITGTVGGTTHSLDTYIITATNAGNEDEATISIEITD